MRKVHTIIDYLHFKELGEIDNDSGYKRDEYVHESPAAPPLHLPKVMRSAHSQVSLNTNSYDQVDTEAKADPESFYMVYKDFTAIAGKHV